jgi:plastocyanin
MRRLTLIAAIAVLAFAGCGGDDEEPASGGSSGGSSSGGENLAISADPGGALKFDKSELTAPAGKVTITMANPSDVPHNVVIDSDGAKAGATVGNGQDSVASADLKAGEYKYYCAVGNHRAEGMEGTLTVE